MRELNSHLIIILIKYSYKIIINENLFKNEITLARFELALRKNKIHLNGSLKKLFIKILHLFFFGKILLVKILADHSL